MLVVVIITLLSLFVCLIICCIIKLYGQSSPKILYLILYNESTDYERQMKQVLDKYVNKFSHITTYYVAFKKLNNRVYEINGNIIYLNGAETYIPGILDKTVKALKLLTENNNYDYIIRSNISTVINLDKLTELITNVKDTNIYGTGRFIFPFYSENNLDSTQFASGTSIILDKISLNYLLNNVSKLRYDIIDDVAIGLLMKSNTNVKYYEFPGFYNNYEVFRKQLSNPFEHIIFFRNKTNNRYDDINSMNDFINYLLSNSN